MDLRNVFVIKGTEALMKGELDNCTISNGHITLDDIAGRHMLYGCYTSPAVTFPEFDSIMMSWNANTPRGTVVEGQVRMMVDGNWTAWCSFGKWSPYIRRGSSACVQRGAVCVGRDMVRLDSKAAFQAQMRIYLYTDNELQTPSVWQMAMSVHCLKENSVPARPVHRNLFVPAYSQFLRAPVLGPCSLPIGVCSMMNRWGQDALPEELALASYDWTAHSCANLLFAAAAAGCWGYPALAAWISLETLRDEIRAGRSVGVRLTYTADPDLAAPGCPCIQAAPGAAKDHMVVVHGFEQKDGADFVLVNDPLAPTDAECARRYPLAEFLDAWDGIGLLMEAKLPGEGWDHPARTSIQLAADVEHEGVYDLVVEGTPRPLTGIFCEGEDPVSVLAVTTFDGVAHATTGHRPFQFTVPTENGVLLTKAAEGEKKRRVTVYSIDETGSMLVGDVSI